MTSIAPFAVFYVGAVLVALTRGTVRQAILLLIPVVGAFNLYHLGSGGHFTWTAFDYTMTLARVDRLSLLFGYLFHLAAFIGIVYALHLKDTTQSVAGVAYAGSALGAVFAGDLLSFFVFWELLTLTSVFLILARRTPRARRAAMRYLLVQIASGVILLAGIAAHAIGNRLDRLRQAVHRHRRRAADLPRRRHQVRLPAAAQLADRHLSGGDPDGDRVPERVHHQGRGLCARPQLRRAPRSWSISAPP